MKVKKRLRSWEHLEDRRCLICKAPFVAMVFWSHGGTAIEHDHWIISSVYCSTKCSRKAHKIFREE